MSGMFDSKTDKVKRKEELTQKQQKARTKRKILTITVTVVFILAVVVSIVVNSAWIRRTLPVITIGGIEFNTAEFEFFYNNELMRISNELQSQGFGTAMLQDRQWVVDTAIMRLQNTVAIYNLAQADGFELSDEKLAELDSMLMWEEFAALNNGFPTRDSYMKQAYGIGITDEIYLEMQKLAMTADEYSVHVRRSLVYSDEQIDSHYAQNSNRFDIFTYRAFLVEAEEPADITEDADIEAILRESIAVAREVAEVYAANIETEEDLIDAAFEYNEYYYELPDYTLLETKGVNTTDMETIDFYFAEWLTESGRKYGDVDVIDTHMGAVVIFFIARNNNDYQLASMRQILIRQEEVYPEDYPEGKDDPDYISALEAAEEDARTRALLVEKLFLDAGGTEQALIDLLEEYSDEDTPGGFYENIAKYSFETEYASYMKVVPNMEAWLFDNRTIGDAELIESVYGYHLTYFMGYGDIVSRIVAEDDMRSEAMGKWFEDLEKPEPVRHSAFILVTI